MLTYLMFAAVIGFALVMRQRNKHKDDYRYICILIIYGNQINTGS